MRVRCSPYFYYELLVIHNLAAIALEDYHMQDITT